MNILHKVSNSLFILYSFMTHVQKKPLKNVYNAKAASWLAQQ